MLTFRKESRYQIIVLICVLVVTGLIFSLDYLNNDEQFTFVKAADIEFGTSLTSGNPTTFQAPVNAPAAHVDIRSIETSSITTEQCYQSGSTWTICFTVNNASADSEWLDFIRLTFPDYPGLGPWNVACNSQQPTDSNGSPVNMICAVNGPNEVTFTDNESETPTAYGEISSGASWTFCIDVTVPGGYTGPRVVNWGLSGDEDPWSALPHDIDGELTLDQCMPLMLTPDFLQAEGCNGTQQTLTFELWNNSTNSGDVDISYQVPTGNGSLIGPQNFFLTPGGIVTFTVALTPELDTLPGEIINANLTAEGFGEFEQSTVDLTVTEVAGWQRDPDSPTPSMDNAVAWAVHDGGLWSVGGYGSGGAAQRYDPNDNTWITYTMPFTPYIEYPMDGCYGLDEDGHEVIVLFPDTIITDTLQRFDITDKIWDEIAVPNGYPNGRWAQDITSLYNVTSYLTPGEPRNVCYISGGSTQEGGGRVKNLWEYHPDTNITIFLQNFTLHQTGFAFHASWFVPWIGGDGAICVAGGIDFESGVLADSECYDIAAANFRGENVDLGQLPEPWWGMADGWQVIDGEYQIWLANGVAQDGFLLPTSAYANETSGGFQYGPELSQGLYRLEGDGWDGQFFTLNGAAGGFSSSNYIFRLGQCPECYQLYQALIRKE